MAEAAAIALACAIVLAPYSGAIEAADQGRQPQAAAGAYTPARTPDGQPDIQGVWNPVGTFYNIQDLEFQAVYQNFRPSDPERRGKSLIVDPPDGRIPYQPWAADARKARMDENGKDDPSSHCLPRGVVKSHTTPLLRKIVQVPGLVVMLQEANAAYRQIFTDGRALPTIEQPTFNGYSVGKWEGDTLVVQTTGFKDGLWLDRSGSPMTDAAKMTERFRRVSYGKLEIDLTVDDPKAYTAPWTVTLRHFIMLDTELLDYICLENEKSVSHMVGR